MKKRFLFLLPTLSFFAAASFASTVWVCPNPTKDVRTGQWVSPADAYPGWLFAGNNPPPVGTPVPNQWDMITLAWNDPATSMSLICQSFSISPSVGYQYFGNDIKGNCTLNGVPLTSSQEYIICHGTSEECKVVCN